MSSESGPDGINPVEAQRIPALTLAMATYVKAMHEAPGWETRLRAADKVVEIYDEVRSARTRLPPPGTNILNILAPGQFSSLIEGVSKTLVLAAPRTDEDSTK